MPYIAIQAHALPFQLRAYIYAMRLEGSTGTGDG